MPMGPSNSRQSFKVDWHYPAVGTQLDCSQPAFSTGGSQLPLTMGCDPRFPNAWRKLPGFRRISTTKANSRLLGSTDGFGLADDNQDVSIEYFKPITVKYGSEPHERRGFVVSANNKLVFKYYDTKSAAWKKRVLVSDIDTYYGTTVGNRGNFDVVCQGRFLYVSRSGKATGVSQQPSPLTAPQVFWWDDALSDWQPVGLPIADEVYSVCAGGRYLFAAGQIRSVGGSSYNEDGRTISSLLMYDGQKWITLGAFTVYLNNQWATIRTLYYDTNKNVLFIGGNFNAVQDANGTAITNTNGICALAIPNMTFYSLRATSANPAGADVWCITKDTAHNLFVGGSFTSLGNSGSVDNLVCYYGWNYTGGAFVEGSFATASHTLADDAAFNAGGGIVKSIEVTGGLTTADRIYVGGNFTNILMSAPYTGAAGEVPTAGTWVAGHTGGTPNGQVYALKMHSGDLFIGGEFTTGSGLSNLRKVARIDTPTHATTHNVWDNPFTGAGAPTGEVFCFASDSTNGLLYIAGNFENQDVFGITTAAGGIKPSSIVVWSGSGTPSKLSRYGDVRSVATSTAVIRSMVLATNILGAAGNDTTKPTLFVGGRFGKIGSLNHYGVAQWNMTTTTPTTALTDADLEQSAQVGGAQFLKPKVVDGGDSWWAGFYKARFKGNNYRHAVFVRFTDPQRGYVSPESDAILFQTDTSSNGAKFRNFTVYVPEWYLKLNRPTRMEVWRSLGNKPIGGTAATSPMGGPYFRESVLVIDPDTTKMTYNATPTTSYQTNNVELDGYCRFTVFIGYQSDESLEKSDMFNPEYDLSGVHGAGESIGLNKGVLFSLVGPETTVQQQDNTLPGQTSYFDVRWTPPWTDERERTSIRGHYFTNQNKGDLPKFISVGDYTLFCTRNQITRFQKSGEYMTIADGPTGVGILSRQAIAAVGGEIWFISNDGDLVRMNAANGASETVQSLTRILSTRWGSYTAKRQMSVAFDQSSQMLVIGPHLAYGDTAIPLEAIVIQMDTGRATFINDMFPRWYESGQDPETGRPTLFYIDTRGCIFAADWSDHGVWENDGTYGGRFYNQRGLQYETPVAVSSVSGTASSLTITLASSLDTDSSFGMAWPSCVYLLKPMTTVNPDTKTRYQIAGIGVATANTTTTITANFSANGGRANFGVDVTAATSSWLVVVAPTVMGVWYPPLRNEQMPALTDRAIIESMTTQFGYVTDFTSTTPSTAGCIYPNAITLETWGYWPFDKPTEDYPGVPLCLESSSAYQAKSVPANVNMDECSVPVQAAGHVIWPYWVNLTALHGRDLELLGVIWHGTIEQAHAGTGRSST